MTSLKRDPQRGDWTARKGIPKDVREGYARLTGGRWEALFRRPGHLSPTEAKRQFAEWLAEVEGRIERLRSEVSGGGVKLSTAQARALAGEWYLWFLAQHEQEPGDPEVWRSYLDDIHETALRHCPKWFEEDPSEDPEWAWAQAPGVRAHVDRLLCRLGDVESFLSGRGLTLAPETREAFFGFLHADFNAAMFVLLERCGGVFRADKRAATFPRFEVTRSTGLTCWGLFEAWIEGKKPAPATVNRWRTVFLNLQDRFGDRAASSITPHEAREWKDGLVTESRSAVTVRDIWLNAADTLFAWAVKHGRLNVNPFHNVEVDVPQRAMTRESKAFTDAEVRVILQATTQPPPDRLARHHADTRRWVPWLCAYTGARPGEMTQLRGADVRQEQGAWVATITPEAGTVKTGKARTVPLHDHLIEQGFIGFVRERGQGPLFFDPHSARKARTAEDATNPSQTLAAKSRVKLGEWVRKVGVTDPEVRPSHAWRHSFKRRAARAKIEKRIRDGFCGHAPGTEGEGYETPELVDLIEAIREFPRYQTDPPPSA